MLASEIAFQHWIANPIRNAMVQVEGLQKDVEQVKGQIATLSSQEMQYAAVRQDESTTSGALSDLRNRIDACDKEIKRAQEEARRMRIFLSDNMFVHTITRKHILMHNSHFPP
jgi:predicted  nucleic acid-binding Zn-ribbon protein